MKHGVPESVKLFSPLFLGSEAAWDWLCDVTSGRERPLDFEMTKHQRLWAWNAGYLPGPPPKIEVIE